MIETEKASGRRLTRRHFVRVASGGVIGLAAASWHTLLFAPTNPVITREEVALPRLDPAFSGLRVVQLSDLHFSRLVSREYLAKCIRMANALEPDIVFLTGDFVTSDDLLTREQTRREYIEPLPELLADLRAKTGIFAVLGNHDVAVDGGAVRRALEKAGIQVLIDQAVALTRGGSRLPLVGLRDYGVQYVNQTRAFGGIHPDEPALIMMHNPDLFEDGMIHRNGLIFSGHLHGGQIRFPFFGPIYVPSRYGTKYLSGRFDRDGLTMFVNRGLGVIHLRARLNARPEITLATLKSGG